MEKTKKTGLITGLVLIIVSLAGIFTGFTAVGVIAGCVAMACVYTACGLKTYIIFEIIFAVILSATYMDNEWKAGVLCVTVIAIPLLLGESVRKKHSLYKMLAIASLAMIIVVASVIIRGMRVYNTSATEIVFGDIIRYIKAAAMQIPELSQQLLPVVDSLWKGLDAMLPAYAVTGSIAFVYIIFLTARVILEKSGIKIEMRHFYEIRLSMSFTVIFIFVEIISFASAGNMAMENLRSVITIIFMASGLSVIDFYLSIKGVKTPLRILIYAGGYISLSAMGIIGMLALQGISFLGILDSVRPLRRFPMQKNN